MFSTCDLTRPAQVRTTFASSIRLDSLRGAGGKVEQTPLLKAENLPCVDSWVTA